MKKLFTTIITLITTLLLQAQCNTLLFNDETEHSFSVVNLSSYEIPGIEDPGQAAFGQSGISSREFIEINLGGKPADKLSFEGATSNSSIGKIINVGVSTNNGESYEKIFQTDALSEDYSLLSDIQLPENVTNIVFYTLKSQWATLNKRVTNIKITQKTFLTAISANPQAFEINYGEEQDINYEFKYSNLPEAIQVTSSSDAITVSETSIGSGCGDYQASYQLVITVNASAAGTYNETVTLQAGNYSLVIPVNYTVPVPYTIASLPTVSNLEIGQSLSQATFEGGVVSTAGHFEWVDGTIVPEVGEMQAFAAIFVPDNAAYPVQNVELYVTVTKKAQEIQWDFNQDIIYVGEQLTLAAAATSGLDVTYSVNDPALASIENNVLTALATGELEITVSQVGNDQYMPAQTIVVYLTVEEPVVLKQDQTITWNQDLDNLKVGDRVSLTAEASSGLAVEYQLADENIAHLDGTELVADAEGTVMIYAMQAGDDTYNAAENFVKFVVISAQPDKENQSIVWEQDFDILHVGDVVELTATATSGLDVEYSVNDETLATIDGNTLTVLAVGELEIYASQSGNEQYEEAPQEIRYATIALADALEELNADAMVLVRDNSVTVSADKLTKVQLFAANGQLIAGGEGHNTITINIAAHQGVLMMVCHINGQRMSRKIVVR